MDIPIVETSRLILRGHRAEDFGDCAAMWADPIVVRHIGGRVFTAEEAWARLLRYVGHWALLRYGFWVIAERASGRFVGEVGFADFKREITPSFDGMPEAGWALATWSHGRGYATEAVTAAHDWLARERGVTKTACMIDPGNEASLRVAEKVGYREWVRTEYKGGPTILHVRPMT